MTSQKETVDPVKYRQSIVMDVDECFDFGGAVNGWVKSDCVCPDKRIGVVYFENEGYAEDAANQMASRGYEVLHDEDCSVLLYNVPRVTEMMQTTDDAEEAGLWPPPE